MGHHDTDVSVIIVSYHCRDRLLACLDQVLLGATDHRLDVTVVDNGSTDGTAEALASRHPCVKLIQMGRNAGFARANNIGISASCGRHVLILNPDTLVGSGAIDRMVAWADEHPSAGVVAGSLVYPDGRAQHTARAFPTPAAALFGRRSPLTRAFPGNPWSSHFLTGRDHSGDEPFQVDWVSGACMLVPRRVIAEVGGFDESYFLYWEDADWCRRMADSGYQVWSIPKARVVHDEGGTRGHRWPVPVVTHFHRGAYLYWRDHHAPQAWNPARWLGALALGARALAIIAMGRTRTVPPSAGPSQSTPEQVMS